MGKEGEELPFPLHIFYGMHAQATDRPTGLAAGEVRRQPESRRDGKEKEFFPLRSGIRQRRALAPTHFMADSPLQKACWRILIFRAPNI